MQKLLTYAGEDIPQIPWNVYPRPQMKRNRWLCLNGEWELRWNGSMTTRIIVPVCPESILSGIKNPTEPGTLLEYHRSFRIPDSWKSQRVILNFEAVSRQCTVFVNGVEVCSHDHAYLPFSADISDYLKAEVNDLCVKVVNDLSWRHPRGKQVKKQGGMWYSPVSGIWQTVWMEPVPQNHIQSLQIETDQRCAYIHVEGLNTGVVSFRGTEIPLRDGCAAIKIEDPILWTPENPWLYSFYVISGEDKVESYFALRTLEIKTIDGIRRLCLNGQPYFFNGVLDQGYWSDGLYTPADPEMFRNDILAMKSLGFNTLRKHLKIEPERYYYECDRLGMVVFQDMVNNGRYHYVRDTVLSTIGMKHCCDRFINTDMNARKIFLESMERTVLHLKNHPCICLWTIFNEGWGQFCSDQAYTRLKALDATRFVDSTSGWFHQKLSDVDSTHIYFRRLRIKQKLRPQLLSEFGGYSYKIPDHSYNLKRTYGYRKIKNRKQYLKDLRKLYEQVFSLALTGLSGAVYTQLSDVEDETNGILTFDRKVCKVSPEDNIFNMSV